MGVLYCLAAEPREGVGIQVKSLAALPLASRGKAAAKKVPQTQESRQLRRLPRDRRKSFFIMWVRYIMGRNISVCYAGVSLYIGAL